MRRAKQLAAHGHTVLALRCDVADDAQVEAMVDQTVATFGRLDVGVQQCRRPERARRDGRLDTRRLRSRHGDQPAWGLELHEVRAAPDAQTRQWRDRQLFFAGRIVGGAERATYHAAKHGVLGLTKSAALEYASRGIRINAICPGLIETPMAETMRASGQTEALEGMLKLVPIGRYGRPEEIADAVLWLCSARASFVVGQSISVDGGFTMR